MEGQFSHMRSVYVVFCQWLLRSHIIRVNSVMWCVSFQRTDVRIVLSTGTVSAAAHQHALSRKSVWAPIYTVLMDVIVLMVRRIHRSYVIYNNIICPLVFKICQYIKYCYCWSFNILSLSFRSDPAEWHLYSSISVSLCLPRYSISSGSRIGARLQCLVRNVTVVQFLDCLKA